MAAISSFALLATASPLVAQTAGSSDNSKPEQTGVSQSTDQQSQDAPSSQPSVTRMNQDQSPGTVINEPAGADNDTNNWGWVGLLGLAGLFGLKRTHHDVDENRRTVRV